MMALTQEKAPTNLTVKLRMLEQMAEALDDQVSALYRRAATFEEEEFLLSREIEERQTEINRLNLKLDSMRSERDRVMEKIESISQEASAMREEIFLHEEEFALATIEAAPSEIGSSVRGSVDKVADSASAPMFFRRMTLSEAITQPLVQN